ncbi:DNA adenine methylase [Aestuariivita sp.]|jgi:DNA adenine methylase|uniref:DNA adenine methylase n=1 Tax=Aestuariivita sp. TaxID=1872407 RepID=UPI00216C87E8|nr:DNA adenine methylase [Aestuariivita sp.]MCE8006562.1 DNA adenine methylase [Aestuariivita sp.]
MHDPDLQPVTPVRPAAPWLGGKRVLAKRLTAILDRIPHSTYAEPFVGMGGIFLRRALRPKTEIINDLGRDIANLFRILQRHYPQFIDCLRFQLTTRVEFERLVATDPATLTDLERAARFLYLQRTAFGGKVSGRNFGVSADRGARFNLTTLEPMLEDLHMRLSGVVIECLPYGAFIDRYDAAGTLFYLDPPYWGCETDYGKDMFARSDFEALADQLRGIEGNFLLSLNDVTGVREVFKGFEMTPVLTSYSIAKQGRRSGGNAELIISSAPLADLTS